MIAYNSENLDNRDIRHETASALAKGLITDTEYQRIEETHPVNFYTPNIFVRIGLILLTALIVAAGMALTLLIAMGAGDRTMSILVILWGLAAFAALEYFIRRRKMFRAGVDDALLWIAVGLINFGLEFFIHMSQSLLDATYLVLTVWGVLRYADRLMALLAYSALISLIFFLLLFNAPSTSALLPFVYIAVSIVTLILFTLLRTKESLRHYHACFSILRAAALLTLYLAGNYFIVQHLDPSFHDDESAPVPLSWLWWTLTAAIPLIYVLQGIRRKDPVFLWTGLALVAASVFTVRYYHHILSAEAAMILAGIILIAVAYILIRYLRIPKHGFTSAAPDEPHPLENLPAQGLILAETFKSIPAQSPNQSPDFGGGSGGGAGAGGTY